MFSANRGYALTSSRRPLIETFLAGGWRVVIATTDDAESQELVDMGAVLEPISVERGGPSLLGDLSVFRRFKEVGKKWQPVLVHNFHAKPVIMGTLAARTITTTTGTCTRIVNTITGLGRTFVAGRLSRTLASAGYRLASRQADATVFQNEDDRDLFLKRGWITRDRARLIVGSGVDIERFRFVQRRGRVPSQLKVLMISRLLGQKGVPEYAEAATRIRRKLPGTRFLLAGEFDPSHPDALNEEWVSAQQALEFVGYKSDVVPLLASADLLVFPSYYREGVPRAVMEAAATGLPTIAFDVPGVREAVRHRVSGLLVPVHDVDSLVSRIQEVLLDEDLRIGMGQAARELAVEAFDIRLIHDQYVALYQSLGLSVE